MFSLVRLASIFVLACASACARPAPAPAATTLAAVSESERAANVSVPDAAACAEAYRAYCGAHGQADRERLARHASVQRSVEDVTLGALSARTGFAPATREAWLAYLATREPADAERLQRLFRKVRAAEIDARTAPLRPTVEREFSRVIRLARDRVAASHAPDRIAALDRLGSARLSWLDPGDTSPLHARALRRGCGPSLLADDAWIDKSATAITLCPGFLLVSRAGADEAAFRDRIALILAHEVGHVIVGAIEHSAEAEREAEIAADAWAAEIVAGMLATIEDPAARAAFLARAIEPICSPEGDRVHPSGAERVTSIASALGCGSAARTPPGSEQGYSRRRITSASAVFQSGIAPSSASVAERSSTL